MTPRTDTHKKIEALLRKGKKSVPAMASALNMDEFGVQSAVNAMIRRGCAARLKAKPGVAPKYKLKEKEAA